MKSFSAAERLDLASQFVHSFPAGTEVVLVGASRDAVDDFVRGLACPANVTFGLHRFSLTQFAARLAIGKLAAAGVTPSSAVGAEALVVRAAYEAAMQRELPYFAPIARFPGFACATAAAIRDLRTAEVDAGKIKTLEEAGPDHAALLERFNQQMNAASVADRAVLFEAALEEVHAGSELGRHPLLLLDVPIHSAVERAFLVELASAAKEGLFTCPPGTSARWTI